jgi:hypothetical protein
MPLHFGRAKINDDRAVCKTILMEFKKKINEGRAVCETILMELCVRMKKGH